MFKGSIVALVTPMVEGKVDVEGIKRLVEFHLEQGTDAIVAAGTTGEAATLSEAEKHLVIKTVVDAVKERIPVIAGTAAESTRATIASTEQAMELGADGALIMTPAYIKPTQQGLIEHYTAIAQSVALPIILYNVPGRTACDMLPETVAELAPISNIVGIKEATGLLERHQQIMELTNGQIDVFSGDDTTCEQLLCHDAKGVISVTANVAPKQMAALCELSLKGDFDACRQLQKQLIELHRTLFIESNPIPVKWAVHKLGLINDEIRLPLTTLSPEYQQILMTQMRQLKLLG